jgi:hypothetical protein
MMSLIFDVASHRPTRIRKNPREALGEFVVRWALRSDREQSLEDEVFDDRIGRVNAVC